MTSSAQARSVVFIALLAILMGGCASQSRTAGNSSLDEAVALLTSLDDAGYEGGLRHEEVALAEALAERAFATGISRVECAPFDPAQGRVVSSGEHESDASTDMSHPVLRALDRVIRDGNRRQRDTALLAIAHIGPGSKVGSAYLQRHGQDSAWARDALSAVDCERWSSAGLSKMWSRQRIAELDAMPREKAAERAIDLMIEQMLDKRLRYPSDVFSDALRNRYADHLTVDALRRLLPILVDDGYSDAIRREAIAFIKALATHPEAFENPLLRLYRTGGGEVAMEAGFALVTIRSRFGSDVLADIIERGEYMHWAWAPGADCAYPPRSDRLVEVLLDQLTSTVPAVRITAITALGCLREESAVSEVLKMLKEPYWSQQVAALRVLGQMPDLPGTAIAQVEEIARTHWSRIVRKAAEDLIKLRTEKIGSQVVADGNSEGEMELVMTAWECFHRCHIEHDLPVCHGEEPSDGEYTLPWIGPFEVQWIDAAVHDIPRGFPIELREMRGRENYGTNTFLRVEGGWLFSVDLWHYDGDLGFVSDGGEVDRFAPESTHAAFIIETQFGITMLGQDVFGGDRGGVLSALHRNKSGKWRYEPLLELPAEAFGYAFAPDGTLLVKDALGAVAITKDREIVPLDCASSGD